MSRAERLGVLGEKAKQRNQYLQGWICYGDTEQGILSGQGPGRIIDDFPSPS